MKPLAKTRGLLAEQGATADNWFIHTPVCCPSRSELITGRYFHNIKTKNPEDKGCMHVDVQSSLTHPFWAEYHYASHLQQAGYTVGVFGKVLNGGNPTCPPPGVDRWFANGGGDYFSPSFSYASAGTDPSSVHFTNCSYNDGACYSTSVIGNASIAWMRDVLAAPEDQRKPFFAYVAVKAPHIQDGPGWPIAHAAPWYNRSDLFPGIQAPRTPNWNASCPDHHYLIRSQPPMTDEEALRSDALYRARWLALLSVDDLVDEVVGEMERQGVADNTYFIFTSDHGYHFGQFRMPQGKWQAYETDIRIPLLIRGPGIAPNSTFGFLGTNVDVMPTVLGLAGVETPSTMDGRSLANILTAGKAPVGPSTWRKTQLVEYNGLGDVVRYNHTVELKNNTYRMLRVIDGQRNLKYAEFADWDNWDFESPADEYELFDLDEDPWEMHNLFASADPALVKDLQAELEQLFRCQGATCWEGSLFV